MGSVLRRLTEQQWLAWDKYPGNLAEAFRGKVGSRKARLFAVACCRRIAHLLPNERCRRGIEVAEQYADGLATRQELIRAHEEATPASRSFWAVGGTCRRAAIVLAAETVSRATDPTGGRNLAGVVALAATAVHFAALPPDSPRQNAHRGATCAPGYVASRAEYAAQCALLRDVFGNPFRTPPAVGPRVLAWSGGTIAKLTQGIYQEGAFDRLTVLADALEDAGCKDPEILAHCRGPGPHARGCWVVDLLFGKPRRVARRVSDAS
jgi:hypothetical protein